MRKLVPILVALVLVWVTLNGCVTTGAPQNIYETNLSVEAQFTALVNQYEIWYQMADEATQKEWKETFDPVFIHLDTLMDSYHNMVAADQDTTAIIAEINRIKTRIMIALTRSMAEKEATK
ncbi:hypothetical protein GWN26_09235 [Candidatus Saccharibacteria bacterium]|nr:hypothetical protein [Candidatus Saccharibacteria bacterium]NIS51221.1 hypothetical protein [Phycisphaerae bacterium]NIV04599.1 hypothetical protein [Calditrichia bacterium]NIS39152.1 hypothetical protein [Candidatus Saccharibacteria bacterium]NIV73229.1 hypothetical protein [Calditrichia bacterium]